MLLAIQLHAQTWPVGEQIGTLPFPSEPIYHGINNDGPDTTGMIDNIFFFDTLHGIVSYHADSGVSDAEHIFYTSNTRTWNPAILPNGVTQINAIRFINGKLYAACFGTDVLVSTDSGATWNLSGLGLGNASDVYADPTGKIRILQTYPGIYGDVFARVDPLHCLWTCSLGSVKISDDGGINWYSIGISTHDGFGCYGDTCTKVFLFDASDSIGEAIICRSTDYGVTWKSDTIDSLGGPSFMEGSSGVVYVSIKGATRSTDDGKTWGTPTDWGLIEGGDAVRHHFPVFGPIGNFLVYSSENEIYLMTSGGDGTLRDPVLSVDSTRQLTTSCNGTRIAIPMLAQAADGTLVQASIVTDSLHEFSILDSNNVILRSYVNDTMWVQYSPHNSPATSILTLNFQNSWHCSDWTETRTIIVTTPPSALAVAPPPLSGGCEVVSDSGFLQIDSCQSLVLTSVSVAAPVTNRLLFQSSLPDTISNRRHTMLPFQFNPRDTTADGIASVTLQGFYLGTTISFDTTLQIHVSAVPNQPELVASQSSLNFGTLALCSGFTPRDTSITFSNTGCATDTITSLTLTGAGFTGVHDSLPIVVLPDSSVTFPYRFSPPDSGMFIGQVNLNVVSMGLKETPSVSLSGQGVQGFGLLDVSSVGLQAGSFSFCAGDTTITDTISNTGCDTLVISNINFSGDTTFSLFSAPGDSLLLPGTSRVFQFTFAPRVKGAESAALTFHSRNIVNDPGHDTTITLAGLGLGGTKVFSADTSLRDFGALYACQSRDTTITLHNTGCDTLTIDSGHVTNGSYATNAVYPIILPPGDSSTVQVLLSMNPGNTNGMLEFFSDANEGTSMVTIPVTASIIPPAHLVLDLSPSDTSAAGSAVTCYVLLEGTVPANAISGLGFDITHNDDLLSYQNANGFTMTGSAGTVQLQVLQFTAGSQAGSATGVDTIGSISFRVYLTDSSSTPLTLSNVTFTNSLSLADNCVAGIVDSGASFTYLFSCGEPLIQDAMLGTLPFTITGIIPNPAQDEITVSVAGVGDHHAVSIEMFDALGRGQDVRSTSLQSGLTLDVSNVPSGIYFLRVSSGGYVQSRSVVVQH